jgi:hypothetical protein
VQIGPANPLYAAKTGFHATMWGIPYDDVESWRGPYPAPVFAAQFEKMADLWDAGLSELEAAVHEAPADRRKAVRADLRYACAAAINFRSVANQTRFILARAALADTLPADQRRQRTAELRRTLEAEIRLARQLFTLTREDSRIGFEPSCQYFYLPLDLVEKVVNCRWLLRKAAVSDQQSAVEGAARLRPCVQVEGPLSEEDK